MPTIDPTTGKRLSGAALRARRRQRDQPPLPAHDCLAPPPALQQPHSQPPHNAVIPAGAAPARRRRNGWDLLDQLLAAAPQAGSPPPPNDRGLPAEHFADLAPPPLTEGVAACEAWAAGLSVRVVVATEQGQELERCRILRNAIRKIGQLADKARRAEKAVQLRELRLGQRVQLSGDPPIDDPLAAVAWAYLRLCRAAYAAALDPAFNASQWNQVLESCGAVGFVACKTVQTALIDQIKALAGAA